MYVGAHKFGRGGGGGRGGAATSGGGKGSGGKRNIFPVPRPRPSGGAPGGGPRRLSVPGGRDPSAPVRSSSSLLSAADIAHQVAVEESFRLVPGNRDTFAAFIRLAPDLISEIKRLEEQGGAVRIKFDTNGNNPSVNVIDVGGKEFRFTWSHETGDLCDIYEEREGGDDGNGLLVESGCPWRKLNVQRILDESTKNHVKMRSEEAERKLKSRKAIILDSSNPSMKSQLKALASVAVSPWKTFKQKKEPPAKNQKVEPPQVGGPPMIIHKSGFPGTPNVKGRLLTSSAPSPLNQSVFVAIASAKSNVNEGPDENVVNAPVTKAENAVASRRESRDAQKGNSDQSEDAPVRKGTQASMPEDLRERLINLLKENPSGISLKGLEEAIGYICLNSACKIPAILRKIATFQAPGKYLLRPEIELESRKQTFAGSDRPPEDNQHNLLAREENHGTGSAKVEMNVAEKSLVDLGDQASLKSSRYEEPINFIEGLNLLQHKSDIFGDRKGSDYSERQVGSSSDSGTGTDSDGDSDCSDSDSDSGSESRSRISRPTGSGSGSSSKSESESLTNSKEGSDADMDIMTSDDEKETKHDDVVAKQDSQGSEAVEIDNHVSEAVEFEDLPRDYQEADLAVHRSPAPYYGAVSAQEFHDTLPVEGKCQENVKCPDFGGRENTVTNDFFHEQPDSPEKPNGKLKRNADVKQIEEMSGPAKRTKVGIPAHSLHWHQAPTFSESSLKVSSGGLDKDHVPNIYNENEDMDASLKKRFNHEYPGKSTLEPDQSGGRASSWMNNPDVPERSGQNTGTWEQGLYSVEQFAYEKSGVPRGTRDAPDISSLKINGKIKESENKEPVLNETQYWKKGNNAKKGDMEESFSIPEMGSSLKTREQLYEPNSTIEAKPVSSKATERQRGIESQQADMEGFGETRKRSHYGAQLCDSKHEFFSNHANETKSHQSIFSVEAVDRKIGDSLSIDCERFKRSPDEKTYYLEYARKEPELKGPIKDILEYKKYVEEYREKYESYSTLNKVLEADRNEFEKLGRDLGISKGTDMERYHKILSQLKERYHQCGLKHKRLKKVFVVLHQELQHLKQRIKEFAAAYTKD